MNPPDVLHFWHSTVGMMCSALLFLTSMFRVWHHRSRADLFDLAWHFCFGGVAAFAFAVGSVGQEPTHLLKSFVILVTLRGVYKSVTLLWGDFKHE